jgi:hypothetical protein
MNQSLSGSRPWRFRAGWNRARVLRCFLSYGWTIEYLAAEAIVVLYGHTCSARVVVENIVREDSREHQR